MRRHIKAADQGKTVITGDPLEGSISGEKGDELLSVRADTGSGDRTHLRDFVPDYMTEKTEMGQTTSIKLAISEKDGVIADDRETWIRDNAYFRWLNAGCPQGQDVKLWCEAENAFETLG